MKCHGCLAKGWIETMDHAVHICPICNGTAVPMYVAMVDPNKEEPQKEEKEDIDEVIRDANELCESMFASDRIKAVIL